MAFGQNPSNRCKCSVDQTFDDKAVIFILDKGGFTGPQKTGYDSQRDATISALNQVPVMMPALGQIRIIEDREDDLRDFIGLGVVVAVHNEYRTCHSAGLH